MSVNCPFYRNQTVNCFDAECANTGMCAKSEAYPTRKDETMEERKEGLSERVLTQVDEWLNAPAEAIQGHLQMLAAMRNLETDEYDALIAIGQRIAKAKQIEAKPKPGRPKGSKTRKESANVPA